MKHAAASSGTSAPRALVYMDRRGMVYGRSLQGQRLAGDGLSAAAARGGVQSDPGVPPPQSQMEDLPGLSARELRQGWRDRYLKLGSDKGWLWAANFLQLAVVLALIGLLAAQAGRTPYKVQLVTVSDAGRIIDVGSGQDLVDEESIDEAVTMAQAFEFITSVRSVVLDRTVQQRYIFNAFARLPAGDAPVTQQIRTWLSEGQAPWHDVYHRAEHELVEVALKSRARLSRQTLELEWEETVRATESYEVLRVTRQRGQITYAYGPLSTDDEPRLLNPLGFYVRDFICAEVK